MVRVFGNERDRTGVVLQKPRHAMAAHAARQVARRERADAHFAALAPLEVLKRGPGPRCGPGPLE